MILSPYREMIQAAASDNMRDAQKVICLYDTTQLNTNTYWFFNWVLCTCSTLLGMVWCTRV